MSQETKTVEQVATLIEAFEKTSATLQQIVGEMQGLASVTQTQGGFDRTLAILKDNAERMETNVNTLQQTVNLVVDRVTDPRTKEVEILASVVNAVMDLGELLDTVQTALGGLTNQIQLDREIGGCAWRAYLTQQGADPADLFENFTKIAMLAEKLQTIVEDDLTQKGYNPKTGEKREWILVMIDKIRAGVGTAVVNFISLGILAGAFWVYTHFGAKTDPQKIQQLQADLDKKEAEVRAEKAEREQMHRQMDEMRREMLRLREPASAPK